MRREIPDVFRPRDVLAVLSLLAGMLGLLALPPSSVATVALIGVGVLLTWVAPAVMIALVMMTVPMQDTVLLPYFRGDLSLTQIAIGALALGWGMTFWRYRIWLDAITMWFLAVGGAFLISFIAMDRFGLWVGEAYRWAVAALFFVICRAVLRDWQSIRVVLVALALTVLATGAYGAGQILAYDGPEHLVRGGVVRVFATFGTPNPFAAYIEFTIPVLLVLALLGLQRFFRERIGVLLWVLSGLATGMGLVMLTFTQSRGGMMGFAAAMIVVLWMIPLRLRVGGIVVGLVLVAMLAMTPAGQSQVHRFQDVFTGPRQSPTGSTYDYGTGRSSLWGAAIGMVENKPWTGVGAGEFDYHYREYVPVWYDRFPRGQAHNGWLQMAAQAGMPGLVAFTGWVAAALVSLIGAARRSVDPRSRALALGGLAVMIAFTVHSLVDYLNVLSLGLQLSVVLAIGLNLAPDPLTIFNRKPASGMPTSVAAPLEAKTA